MDAVERTLVEQFEAALDRTKKDVGYMVAFSFTRDAYREAARVHRKRGWSIALITVRQLLEAKESITRPKMPIRQAEPTPDLMRLFSALQEDVDERPLPPARPKDARPSVEALVKSP